MAVSCFGWYRVDPAGHSAGQSWPSLIGYFHIEKIDFTILKTP